MSNSQGILIVRLTLFIDILTIIVKQLCETIKRLEVNQLLEIFIRDLTTVCNCISKESVGLELTGGADVRQVRLEHYGATYMGGIIECWSL